MPCGRVGGQHKGRKEHIAAQWRAHGRPSTRYSVPGIQYASAAEAMGLSSLRAWGGRTDGRAGGFKGLVRLLAGSALIRTGD